VELTRKERALLLQHASNVLNSPSTFLTGYDEETDLEQIVDFLMLLQYHLIDNPPLSSVDMQMIDLFTAHATPLAGVGTLTYNPSATLPFGYAISTQNTTLYGMEQPVWLKAGEWDYVGWASLSSTGGNTGVAITDGSSVIDTIIASVNQSGSFGTRVKHTGSFTITEDGLYKMVVANVSVSAGNVANWISHHLRRTA